MAHDTKPKPTLSDAAMSRRPVVAHDGKPSVHVDFNDPDTRLQNGSPGSGSAPGSSGPPTTGAVGPGGALGMD